MRNSLGVELHDLSKVYRTRRGTSVEAVAGVSLHIEPGQFLSIVGPSGCGKSTLLMMVAGLIPSSSGEVRIGGRRVAGPFTDVGIVFQRDLLFEWRTVLQNVLLPVELKRLPGRGHRERAIELLRRVGLAGFEDKYPHELSGGMRQRAAICRALIHEPPLLLMDEPFGALDALTREQMNLDLIRLCAERRYTVLFITHSIEEAVFLSDRVVVMSSRPGRILKVVDNELPRPRTVACRQSPAFHEHVAEIRDLFQTQGILQEGS